MESVLLVSRVAYKQSNKEYSCIFVAIHKYGKLCLSSFLGIDFGNQFYAGSRHPSGAETPRSRSDLGP